MDASGYQHGFQYSLLSFEDPGSSVPLPVTAAVHSAPSSSKTSSEGEPFNDSGYFSPQMSQFTTAVYQLRPSNQVQQNLMYNHSPSKQVQQNLMYNHSPSKAQGSLVGDLIGTPQPNWQEDLSNVNDEWDRNFINSFEENLFGFDTSDLNTMVDGILGSPFKSSVSSPFKSPSKSRSAAAVLGISPFKNQSTSDVMLTGLKRSPGHMGGSPFKSPFSSPSPVRSLNSHTRISPMTRQRRLILQSPGHKSENLSDQFPEIPEFLDNIKEEPEDELGILPFQRSNSFGFTPQCSLSPSPPLSALCKETFLHPIDASVPAVPTVSDTTSLRHHKRIKTESSCDLHCNTAKNESYNLRSPIDRKSAQSKKIFARHMQLINDMPSKDALRLVRQRFREVLERASSDAVIREKKIKSRMKASAKKPQLCTEISQVLSDSGKSGHSNFTQILSRPFTKRQEILPKPTPDWPRRELCKIAPKKRKR